MPISRVLAVPLALLTCIMSNCSAPQHAPSESPPALDGTSWVLSELPGRTLVGGERPTATFEGSRVYGTDGCNRYAAPVTAAEGAITVGPQGPSTMMACPPEVMSQADAFLGGLRRASRYRVADGRLTLLAADDAVLMVFAAQSQALAGTRWEVVNLNNGRGAVTGMVQEGLVTMEFSQDGKVAGLGGCNRYTASFVQEGASLRFGPVASTRMMCPDAAVMEQEQALFKALETVSTLRVEGGRLEMRTADGALAVGLRRVDS